MSTSRAVASDLDATPTPTALPTIDWSHISPPDPATPTLTPPLEAHPDTLPPTSTSSPTTLEQPPTSTSTHAPPSATPTNTLTPTATATATATSTSTSTPTTIRTSTATRTATVTTTITSTTTPTPSWLPPGPECYVKPGKPVLTLQVPFIHQVYDIVSADGNWACGPTSVAMVLAYYGKLQPWQDTAPENLKPTEGSQFAPYITEVYTSSNHTYGVLAADPQGKKVAGLYGTICPTGLADWSQMKRVLEWHGLNSKHIPLSFEGVKAALTRGHPVLIGNDLTPAGHVLVAIGYTANNQLIVNDPYGNRFASGYGSTGGKSLSYSWKCLRPTNALEVIGTYPPPATPTSTPGPATVTPTATATPSLTATPPSSPTSRPSPTGHARTTPPENRPVATPSPVRGHSTKQGRIEVLVANSSTSLPLARVGLALGLMFLATLVLAGALFLLLRFDRAITGSTRRKPQD
ncbi:MAG: C39 family peptidase [Chloroflexia bacterium]